MASWIGGKEGEGDTVLPRQLSRRRTGWMFELFTGYALICLASYSHCCFFIGSIMSQLLDAGSEARPRDSSFLTVYVWT